MVTGRRAASKKKTLAFEASAVTESFIGHLIFDKVCCPAYWTYVVGR